MKAAARAARWAITTAGLLTLVVAMPAAAQSGAGKGQGAKDGPPTPFKVPTAPKTPRVPTTFEELYADRLSRAQDALAYLRCYQSTYNALSSGVLGRVPRAWLLTCVKQGGEWRGVFGEPIEDAPGFRVHLQYALRGPGGVRTTDPVDTARVNGMARALLRGLSAPAPGGGKYDYMPITLPQDGYTEVWFLPVPNTPMRVVTGGDSLIQMTTDGTREMGHTRVAPPIRTFAVQPTGNVYVLESKEERVPLLSELVVAHMALTMVPEVKIRTHQYESTLTRGSNAVRHVQR